MRCPQCGREMEPGWVYCGGRTLFTPGRKKASALRGQRDIPIKDWSLDRNVAAERCEVCQVTVLLPGKNASPRI